MTRGTMRTLLRRRLQESVADQWQDTDLDEMLNLGLHEVQQRIMAVDPAVLFYIDNADLVQDQDLYKKPVGFWYEAALQVKSSASTDYQRLKRDDDPTVDNLSSAAIQLYSHFGQYFRIKPAPSANVADGIRLIWMPTMSMADDSDVPDIPIGLHMAVVVATQLLTMGELGVDRSTIAAELEALSNPEIIARYYFKSGADNDQLKLDLGKQAYGRGSAV